MQKHVYRQMYELEDTHWWFLAKRSYIAAVLPKPNHQWNILDVGSGTGGLSRYLSHWGTVTCVEASAYAIPYLRKRKITYVQANISEYTAPRNSYDLVCLCDVLYHQNIRSDRAVLKRMYRSLRPGGYLCITDSALPYLTSHHDVIMNARERYYLGVLVRKVSESGFIIIRKSYIYFFIFPIVALIRFVNKFFPFQTMGTVSPFLNTILLHTCELEAGLLRYVNYPIGSSVIIVAQKQK